MSPLIFRTGKEHLCLWVTSFSQYVKERERETERIHQTLLSSSISCHGYQILHKSISLSLIFDILVFFLYNEAKHCGRRHHPSPPDQRSPWSPGLHDHNFVRFSSFVHVTLIFFYFTNCAVKLNLCILYQLSVRLFVSQFLTFFIECFIEFL